MSNGGTSESAGGERDAISARNSSISASRFFVQSVQPIGGSSLSSAPCCVNNPSSHTTQLHKRQVERAYSNIVSRLTSQESKTEKSAKYCTRPMALRMPGHFSWPALVVCDVTVIFVSVLTLLPSEGTVEEMIVIFVSVLTMLPSEAIVE